MNTESLSNVSDGDLVARLVELVREGIRWSRRRWRTGAFTLADQLVGAFVREVRRQEHDRGQASGKNKTDIEILLARRSPRPDVSERLERLEEQTTLVLDREPDAREVVLEPVPPVPPRVVPLSPARFALQLTISEATREKLLRAQALLRHQLPSGDLAELLDLAVDALLEKVHDGVERDARSRSVVTRRHARHDLRRTQTGVQ